MTDTDVCGYIKKKKNRNPLLHHYREHASPLPPYSEGFIYHVHYRIKEDRAQNSHLRAGFLARKVRHAETEKRERQRGSAAAEC